MPIIKITLDKDLPKGAYSFELTPFETDEVIIPEIPDSPVLKPEPPFPQLQNIKFLKNAESINKNTITPFKYKGITYLICYNADNDKCELYDYTNGFVYLLNLDLILDGKEIRGIVHSICPFGADYYGLMKMDDAIYLIKLRHDTQLKQWDVLGEVDIPGAKDALHDLYIGRGGAFMIHGRARNVDWPKTTPVNDDRRGIKILTYGTRPESILQLKPIISFIDPVDHAYSNYETDQYRKGLYGSMTIIIGSDVFTFINTYFQNDERGTGERTDRENVGTGPIYPCVVKNYGNVVAWDKHLIEQTPFLRDWPHEDSLGYNPGVGQLYIGGLIDRGDIIEAFIARRWDDHYLEMKGQNPTELYSGILDKQALIDWFNWKEQLIYS